MFEWSSLDRNTIIETVMELAPKVCDIKSDPNFLHLTIKRHLRKIAPITITQCWEPAIKNNIVAVGGTYFSDRDEDFKTCIDLALYYNPNAKTIKLSKRRLKRMALVTADTLLHEIIHMRQYRRRDFKSLPNYSSTASRSKTREQQEYLGCTDEIDAYGFNIACELLDKFKGDHQKAINFLDEDQTGRINGSCYLMYLKAFNHDHDHEIIKRLKKKVIRYLPRAEVGKPFKSCDWICY